MKLKYKDTLIDLDYRISDDLTGLGLGDSWIYVKTDISNNEINYHDERKNISLSELKMISSKLDDVIVGNIKSVIRISLIKNFYKFILYPNQTLEIKFQINKKHTNNYYSLYFDLDEIKEFNLNIKKIIEKNN